MLYLQDLEKLHCQSPGCDHKDHDGLYLNPRCHMGMGVTMTVAENVCTVRCFICRKAVAHIAVENKPDRSCDNECIDVLFQGRQLTILGKEKGDIFAELIVRRRDEDDRREKGRTSRVT